MESCWGISSFSVLQTVKSSGDWLHNEMDVLHTEHLKMVKIVNCMVCVFNQYFFKGSESVNNSIIWTTHCIILFLQQLYEAGAFIILIL